MEVKLISNETISIASNFVDRHSDFIEIYMTLENGKSIITDDSETLLDLEISGLSIEQDQLNEILSKFNVSVFDKKLYIEIKDGEFKKQKDDLLKAILEINEKATSC